MIITALRNNNGLWNIPLRKLVKRSRTQTPAMKTSSTTINSVLSPSVKGIIRVDEAKAELAQYLIGACLNPVSCTFLRAIKRNYFTSCPGLTCNLISKHLPKVEATFKSRLDQEQKNLRSTKQTDTMDVNEDIDPRQEVNNTYTGDIMCSIRDTAELTSKSYSD